jgi:hypothetical protein
MVVPGSSTAAQTSAKTVDESVAISRSGTIRGYRGTTAGSIFETSCGDQEV